MSWNIAHAKQQFSELVRLTAQEPQAIYNRDKPVAVMISPDEFEQFRQWKAKQEQTPLVNLFDDIRAILVAEGADGIEVSPRTTRHNPLTDDSRYWSDEADFSPPNSPATTRER